MPKGLRESEKDVVEQFNTREEVIDRIESIKRGANHVPKMTPQLQQSVEHNTKMRETPHQFSAGVSGMVYNQ